MLAGLSATPDSRRPQGTHDRIREAYLSYRLDSRELVDLVQGLKNGVAVEPTLEIYTRDSHDENRPVAPQDLQDALQQLGLSQQFGGLPEDTVWTPYQRALYRRLSHPEYDPKPYQNKPDQPGSPELCEVVQSKFEEWDRNHDTRLTPAELDRAMASGETSPEEDAALVLLRSRVNALGSCNPSDGDGVSTSDLGIFASQGIPGGGILTEKINQDYHELLDRAGGLSTPAELGSESFDSHGVNQNRLGSCVLLSTAAGLPSTELSSMFSSDGSGNTEVKFKNGESEIVYEPTRTERLYHAYTNDDGRWPAVLEIAVGQYLARKLRPQDGSIRTAADGIPAEEAFELLTGKECQKVSLDELTPVQARQQLQQLEQIEGPKVCGSRPELPSSFPERELEYLHNGIENGHCYTLLHYDADHDQVVLRNPWNRKLWVHSQETPTQSEETHPHQGIFTMPFPQFYASFRWVASQQTN